jgi:GR25 family glycosyltransferase involved in LPS biosynthesis
MLFTLPLCGELEHHLKKILHKSPSHTMPGIDFIYMINLEQRQEKWKTSLDQLAPYGIFPYRFSAVNGWELSLETINDVGVVFTPGMKGDFMGTSYHRDGNFEPSHEIIRNYGQTYFAHCMARGTIGCALSHLSILQDAWDSGYETIWIMEDDIEVKKDPRILSGLIHKLDILVGNNHWDILFTDRDMHNGEGNYNPCYGSGRRPDYFSSSNDFYIKKIVSEDFWQVGARFGTHSMIVRRSGIQKLLQFFKTHQIFLPYDLDFVLPEGIKLYAVLEDVVTNFAKAPSDNGEPNYLKKP